MYDFRLHLNKMVIDGDSLLSQQNLDFKTAKNDFSDLEIVILSLIDRLEKLQSIKDISLKQYESLRSLAVQSSVQLERLLKAQQFVSARLATLAQGDKPWEQELEALRIEILEEFAGNSESR